MSSNRSSTTTNKSAKDPFHLEKDLAKIKKAEDKSKAKAPEPKAGSSSTGDVGAHVNAKPMIEDDASKWPKDSEKFTKDGITLLRNKKTGAVTHVVRPAAMKGHKTKSARQYLMKLLPKKK